MSIGIEKYEMERAEVLARLILTRRKGVSVHTLEHRASGLDFIVSMNNDKVDLIAAFGGVIASTPEQLPDVEAAQNHLKGWKQPKHLQAHFPILLFLFSTADDQGYFSWILQPHGGKLEWVSSLEMHKITKKSLDAIFETAERWNKTLTATLAKISAN